MKRQLLTATLVQDNIYESDRIGTAFVCGFVHPKIYVPVGVAHADLSFILEHERTHIRRYDYLIKPLAFFALILHWFNPLMWLSFALMNRDMEMSCDESVLHKMNPDAKGGYSSSLLALSVKRNGLFAANPLAFGESHVKTRIKNVLNYKKPKFWVIVLAVMATVVLIAAFTTNPKHEQPVANSYWGYSIDALMDNKTPYVGNNVKVIGLIDAMPLPEGVVRAAVELKTSTLPYGITINYILNDYSGVLVNGAISGDAFYRNAIMLFSLIDNVDVINCNIADKTGQHDGALYTITFTREMAETLVGEDVRPFAGSADTLKNLIDRISNASLGTNTVATLTADSQIEKYLELIVSSPSASSNPHDYIAVHQNEYESILKMGEDALQYMLTQFEAGNAEGLRGQIMMQLCKEILGVRNNVADEYLSPQEWYNALSIGQEIKLPDFKYEGLDRIEALVYNTEIDRKSYFKRGGFMVVAPKIFSSYEEEDLLKVFVTTYSASYQLFGNVLSPEGGSIVPAAITYRQDGSGGYILEKYEQAQDGSYFSPSIKEFCTMPASGQEIHGLADKILKHYGDYDDIRILMYNNLFNHLKKNSIKDATLTNSLGEVEFSMSNPRYKP